MIHVKMPIYMKANLPVQKQNRLFQFQCLKKDNTEMYRRYKAKDGHEIIDKATYNKLMKPFFKAGGIVQQGAETTEHLNKLNAAVMYINGSNVILLREQPRVSEVLEETFHAKQDRANRFGVLDLQGVISIKREIEAQKYLLSVKDKYKIPEEKNRFNIARSQSISSTA